MKRISIQQFQEKSYIEIVEELMKKNNGYITSRELDMFDIHRMYLSIMQDKGIIRKVASGIYIDVNKIPDKYYVFSLSMPNVIFSHMTALYFYDLSKKVPNDVYDITVRRTYNSAHLKNHNVFYVDNNIYEIGLTEIETSMGNKIKIYDMERCICDVIRSRNRMNSGYVKYSIKEYMKRNDKDIEKLLLYAEKFGIKEIVMNYVGRVINESR